MRLGWPHGYLIIALFSTSLGASASGIQCANEANVVNRPFPEGTVVWSVTMTPDAQHTSDELTIDVIVDSEIEGKIFGFARVYVGDRSGQNFDLQTSDIIPAYLSDGEVPGIAVSFGTSAHIDRPVTFKFSYFEKSLCPEVIIVYELQLSAILDSGGDGKARSED